MIYLLQCDGGVHVPKKTLRFRGYFVIFCKTTCFWKKIANSWYAIPKKNFPSLMGGGDFRVRFCGSGEGNVGEGDLGKEVSGNFGLGRGNIPKFFSLAPSALATFLLHILLGGARKNKRS